MDLEYVFQRSGRGRNKSLVIATADTGTKTLVTSRGAAYTIYVQRIIVTISTDAAQSITFQDSAGSPLFVEKVSSSPGVNTRWEFYFGVKGQPLTLGANLVAVLSGAGLGANINWNCYEVPLQ